MSSSTTFDINELKNNALYLAELERSGRRSLTAAGVTKWDLGDGILATLDDVKSLVARVEELEAELARRSHEPDPLRAALVGILRADGWQVMEPGKAPPPRIEFRGVGIKGDPAQALGYYTDMLVQTASAASEFNPDAAASDMLGEDERDDGASEAMGTVCPKCKGTLVSPGGACRYLDCAKPPASADPAKPTPIENGASVRIVGGHWDGRYAIALGSISAHGGRHSVEIAVRGVELTGARDIAAAMVFVVNPAVDEPIVKTGPIQPSGEGAAPAASPPPERKRAEDPPVAIADWSLADKDLAEVAAKLGRTVDEVKRLVAAFKLAMKDRAATPRWRPAFTAWAVKNGSAVLAQATIPGA